MEYIKEGNSVLYLWSKGISEDIQKQVNEIKTINNVSIKVENVERLPLGLFLVFILKFLEKS
jgi:hypothetical protein